MFAESKSSQNPAENLQNESAFPHAIEKIELIETHISWIILTGDIAYKIKKPVHFDFVDYSTLERRKHFCHQEVELNRRFAPEIYIGVVPIVDSGGQLKVLDENFREAQSDFCIVEYAVKMRQFRQDAIVAARLKEPGLTTASTEEFGKYIARFHDEIEVSLPTRECVQPDRIGHDAAGNFAVPMQSLGEGARSESLKELEAWTVEQVEELIPKFELRLANGFVRRCHGDLHLKNIIQVEGQLLAFDGIEFNEAFQWIDVLSEIAFPVMDCWARGRKDLAWRILNSYLEATGDYESLEVLRFYMVYRAMVRVKVTCLNPANNDPEIRARYVKPEDPFPELAGPWDKYLEAASFFAFGLRPELAITHGFSGSGKSTIGMQIIDRDGGIRLRSDVERHREAAKFKIEDKYSAAMSDWIYRHLAVLATAVLESGLPIIVDATFLKHQHRLVFQELAVQLQVPYEIIDCHAEFDELCRRIRDRGQDPSEATVAVLRSQMESHDPLTVDELGFVVAQMK